MANYAIIIISELHNWQVNGHPCEQFENVNAEIGGCFVQAKHGEESGRFDVRNAKRGTRSGHISCGYELKN